MFRALKWLFIESPINLTRSNEKMYCRYCGKSDGGIWNYQEANFKICQRCMKKAFDSSLIPVDGEDQ